MYPLFFEPVYKEIIWGGRKLEKYFNRNIPDGNIAESWEVSCHKSGMSIIRNGELKGTTLKEVIDSYGEIILGKKYNSFPLLVKLIDANDKLSVQVHPDDDYAKKFENQFGKTEMWYVIDAKENAQLVYGLKSEISKEKFIEAINLNKVEECLNYVNVSKGDVIFIPSGTVHAIMDGLLLAEIQQSSDVTYRLYDWNRVDKEGKRRELHIDKALDVINFNFEGNVLKPEFKSFDGYEIADAIKCPYFEVSIIKVNLSYKSNCNGSFKVYTAVEGEGEVLYNGISYKINCGDSFLMPAELDEYEILGKITLLETKA
nr:type I phosphomannose isomerase catalytic subunit [Caloramator mitchellensis]